MRFLLCLSALLLLSLPACRSQAAPPELSPEPRLDAFAREVARELEAHAWESLLERADPEHYRVQVVEHGMPEPQYVAELFGLHSVDNDIGRGGPITWADLERIERVRLRVLEPQGDGYSLTGEVGLGGGETLELRATILEEEGELRLTGAFG